MMGQDAAALAALSQAEAGRARGSGGGAGGGAAPTAAEAPPPLPPPSKDAELDDDSEPPHEGHCEAARPDCAPRRSSRADARARLARRRRRARHRMRAHPAPCQRRRPRPSHRRSLVADRYAAPDDRDHRRRRAGAAQRRVVAGLGLRAARHRPVLCRERHVALEPRGWGPGAGGRLPACGPWRDERGRRPAAGGGRVAAVRLPADACPPSARAVWRVPRRPAPPPQASPACGPQITMWTSFMLADIYNAGGERHARWVGRGGPGAADGGRRGQQGAAACHRARPHRARPHRPHGGGGGAPAPTVPAPALAPITPAPLRAPITPAPLPAPITPAPLPAPITPAPLPAPITPAPAPSHPPPTLPGTSTPCTPSWGPASSRRSPQRS
jgi:hypothetical protein